MRKRTSKIVKCRECGLEFSSWGHKSCYACRPQDARYDACPECNAKKYKRSSLCAKCSRSGERNGNWAGGKTQHSKGYTYVRVKEHPKVTGEAGYVAEHVLVVEQHIGRFLVEGENVHHLNGLRSDNRIENLELWCKPQPAGCRAEDAYNYALEIVERYRGIFG